MIIIVNTNQSLPEIDTVIIRGTLHLAGAKNITFTEHSVSIEVPITDGDDPFRELAESMAEIEAAYA